MDGLFIKEWKKILRQKGLLVILVLLVLNIVSCCFEKGAKISINRYNYYAEKFAGEYTEEKKRAIEEINTEIQTILSSEINYDDQKKWEMAKLDESIIKLYMEKSIMYSEAIDYKPVFFKDYQIYTFLNGLGVNFFSIAATLFVIFTFWIEDKKVGLLQMIKTSVKGKSVLISYKIIITLILTICISILFSLSEIVVFVISNGLEGMNNPIQSIMGFTGVKYSISIMDVLCMISLCRAVWMISFAALIVVATEFVKSSILSCSMLVSYMIIGIIVKNYIGKMDYLFVGAHIDGVTDLNKSVMVESILVAVIIFIIGLGGTMLYSARKISTQK